MAASTSEWERAPWYLTYVRFLSGVQQAALNASGAISNSLCHNINPSRPLSSKASSRDTSTSFSNRHQDSRPVYGSVASRRNQAPKQVVHDPQFDAYLTGQGPRALELASREEYRKHYEDSVNWRRNMGVDTRGEPLNPAKLVEDSSPCHGVFERSVEKQKRLGTEELDGDWIRFCKTHGSRGTQHQSSPSNIILAPCERMDVDEDMKSGTSDGRSAEGMGADMLGWSTYPAVPGPPHPVEPPMLVPPVPPVSIRLNDSDNRLTGISPLSHISAPYSPPALSATSSLLSTPLSYNNVPTPRFSSPLPRTLTVKPEQERKTTYFALYPSDHRLGFDCTCKTCRLKAIKKERPDAIPTLFERRAAKRTVQEAEAPVTPRTPSDTYYKFSSKPVTPNSAPSAPVEHFVCGNVQVPMYHYKEYLRELAPSTWLLGETVVLGVKSRDRSQANRKRARNTGISVIEGEETPAEEHGEGKRRRRK